MSAMVKVVVGGAVGAVVGYLMYRFVGCRTGACPLTGNPYVAVILWGAIGAVLAAGK